MKKEHQEEYIRIKTEKLIEMGIEHDVASALATKKMKLKKKVESLKAKKLAEEKRKEREAKKAEKKCPKKVSFANFSMQE